MPSLQNKTHIHCRVQEQGVQNWKHIGDYWDVQKTSISKFNQEHDGKLKHRNKTLENKSVVQKMKYNKNCDKGCADVRAPCLIALTFIYII